MDRTRPEPANSNSDLIAGHALGNLTPEELAAVEAELAADPALADELAMLHFAVDALPLSLPPREPSASLRDRLAAAVDADLATTGSPQMRDSGERVATAAPTMLGAPPALRPVPAPPPPTQLAPPRAFPVARWAFAAAAVLLVAIGVVAWVLQQRQATEPVRTVAFAISDEMPDARGQIAVMAEPEPMMKMSVANLPPLPDDRVYEVWLIPHQGAPIPAGTFRDTTMEHAMPGDASAYQAVAITVEPGPDGTDAPTTDPFAVADLMEQ